MNLPTKPYWNQRFWGPVTFGQLVLGVYVLAVLVISVLHDATGQPSIAQLASSPQALLQGRWWSLVSSGFIVEGPPLPQLIAITVLGVLGIYFHGAWVFWRTAILGHFAGTLVTYGAVGLVWLADPRGVARLLVEPDYGVSLVWCAALGVLAATMLISKHIPPVPKYLAASGAVSVFMFTTLFSTGIAAYEHIAAFAIGVLVILTLPKHHHVALSSTWKYHKE